MTSVLVSLQMEDGHTLFDYDVRLNDTIQLLVRQNLMPPPSSSSSNNQERDSELSDTDSGYCLGQSESDKSSTSGEVAVEADRNAGLTEEAVYDETELGLYKVRHLQKVWGLADLCTPEDHSSCSTDFGFPTTQPRAHEGGSTPLHPGGWAPTVLP